MDKIISIKKLNGIGSNFGDIDILLCPQIMFGNKLFYITEDFTILMSGIVFLKIIKY